MRAVFYMTLSSVLIGTAITLNGNGTKRIVVLSINENPFYNFYAPIVALVWNRYGFLPLVIAYGEISLHIEQRLRSLGMYKRFDLDKRPSFLKAQISRLFAACMLDDAYNDYYLMISDIDMIPIDQIYFATEDKNYHFNIRNGYALLPNEYPMCYLGGKVRYWKDAFCKSSNDIETYVNDLVGEKSNQNVSHKEWGSDQLFAFQMLNAYGSKHLNSIQLIALGKRQDRSNWRNLTLGVTDSHLPRPGFYPMNFLNVFQDTLIHILNKTDILWVKDYVQNYQQQVLPFFLIKHVTHDPLQRQN